ncbi:BTB/POZ and MATH domain-containing protein 2 [Rhynchospora pubera]|uniref:BTB/POZ and MATH domain-containing protein 2 n=1 Tax=Rhynchospora pubera TaxID=906938 RepID=A0AAV8GER3_9POAL|nr:BTB/POZ and MATH domain-containing protein 2 [Rhynchospora pubera]
MEMASTATNHDAGITKVSKVGSGSHRCEIDFSQVEKIEIGRYITSPTFLAGGHEWSITCYPLGNKESANGTYLSLFLDLRSDSKDVSVIFDFNLLDKEGRPSATQLNRTSHVFEKSGYGWGWPQFIRAKDLKESYVVDDHFVVVCTITVLNASSCPVMVPPSDLHLHFGKLLEDKENADVTFDVEGEFFHAHRLVLATRSPVFKAELYGMMHEHSSTDIKIHDMDPLVFRSLLHFIYTDSLPDDEDEDFDDADGDDDSSLITDNILMTQHLLVAADRYALDRLKLMCEAKLYKNITVDTVATTLAIAEQHNCSQLKDVCVEYATVSENYTKIVSTDGFDHLQLSCPVIIEEIQHKINQISIESVPCEELGTESPHRLDESL